jgi:hypothetical protein
MFEWYIVKFVVKEGHREDMYNDKIGLCDLNIYTILSSIVSTIGWAHVISRQERGSSLQRHVQIMLNHSEFTC